MSVNDAPPPPLRGYTQMAKFERLAEARRYTPLPPRGKTHVFCRAAAQECSDGFQPVVSIPTQYLKPRSGDGINFANISRRARSMSVNDAPPPPLRGYIQMAKFERRAEAHRYTPLPVRGKTHAFSRAAAQECSDGFQPIVFIRTKNPSRAAAK